MRYFLLLVSFFIYLASAQSQNTPPTTPSRLASLDPCNCSSLSITAPQYNIGSEKEALKVINGLLDKIAPYRKFKITESIKVKEAICETARAEICPPNTRVIFYSKAFLENMNKEKGKEEVTLVDKHILAHELGHHVFGHPVNAKNISRLAKPYLSDVSGSSQIMKRHKIDNQLHVNEIQADFFALWILFRTEPNFNFDQFITHFDAQKAAEIEAEAKKREKNTPRAVPFTHPLFQDRLNAMQDFWKKLLDDQYRSYLISPGYFSGAANAAYIQLDPEKTFWDVSITAGMTIAGKPRLKVNALNANTSSVNAFLYRLPNALNPQIGLAVSAFNFNRPIRFEGEATWTKQTYGTLIDVGATSQLLEKLALTYLSLYPRITWSPVGQGNSQRLLGYKIGFFTSLGGNFRFPLNFSYTNYANPATNVNLYTLQNAISPRLSVGVELIKKSFIPKGYKLAISYEPQFIRIAGSPKPKGLSHNFDCTLYYTVFRR